MGQYFAGFWIDALSESFKQIPGFNGVQVKRRSMFNAPDVGKTMGDGALGAFVLRSDSSDGGTGIKRGEQRAIFIGVP